MHESINKLSSQAAYEFVREKIGSLDCGVVRPREIKVRSLAIFCHGYGANGDDLVGLAPEFLESVTLDDPEQGGTVMIFPHAPISMEEEGIPGGGAWWLLSIQRLLSALEDGRYEEVREEVPDGIEEARDKLVEVISQGLDSYGLDESNLLLGGFSQGSMLSVETALRGLEKPPAQMVLYSSCLICEREWKPLASKLQNTKIFQSHGRLDPVLPLQTGKWLEEMLTSAGCNVDFHEFNGIHTIPRRCSETYRQHVSRLLGSAFPRFALGKSSVSNSETAASPSFACLRSQNRCGKREATALLGTFVPPARAAAVNRNPGSVRPMSVGPAVPPR